MCGSSGRDPPSRRDADDGICRLLNLWLRNGLQSDVAYAAINDDMHRAPPEWDWHGFQTVCAIVSDAGFVGLAELSADIGLSKVSIFRCKEGAEMPEQETVKRAQRDIKEGKSPSTAAGEFVREEIDHVREGKHGARSPQQAIAIGLSKARRAGVPLRPPKKGKTSESTRKSAEREYEARQAGKKAAKTRASRRAA